LLDEFDEERGRNCCDKGAKAKSPSQGIEAYQHQTKIDDEIRPTSVETRHVVNKRRDTTHTSRYQLVGQHETGEGNSKNRQSQKYLQISQDYLNNNGTLLSLHHNILNLSFYLILLNPKP
jgi:hypothetical protein